MTVLEEQVRQVLLDLGFGRHLPGQHDQKTHGHKGAAAKVKGAVKAAADAAKDAAKDAGASKPDSAKKAEPASKVPIAKPRPKPKPIKPASVDDTLATAPKALDGKGDRSISAKAEAALEKYQGKSFSEINDHLRGRGEGPKPKWVDGVVEQIDSVHEQSRLTQDVVVHRGIGSVSAVFGPASKRKLTGAEWTDDAFQSTTANPNTAQRFMRNEEGRKETAILNIRVPAGVGAIQLSDDRYEAEMLLERGLRMRVISDTGPWRRGQKRPRTIEVEVVPV